MSEVLILNQKLAHSFSYYDLETGRELHRIRFPDYPHEFAVESDCKGKWKFAAQFPSRFLRSLSHSLSAGARRHRRLRTAERS